MFEPKKDQIIHLHRMRNSITIYLTLMMTALTGFFLGALHVWSGPDHLAAIAPLAARQIRQTWVPGVRWGLGHSSGVALVGLMALLLRDTLPMEAISSWGESMVGVLLIGIGVWGFRKAAKINVHTHSHKHDGSEHQHVHVHAAKPSHEQPEAHARHTHAALGVGILHGLAGSSHLLGVLPMLVQPTKLHMGIYLGSFALGTIVSMGIFSSLVGLMAARCSISSGLAYRRLMGACASAAMLVGFVWIGLSFC
jgi:ABC-type nickel/cobalt efflux system permease component RcnA